MDRPVRSIQDYIDPATIRRYDAVDMNVYQANLFHTRMNDQGDRPAELPVQNRRL